MVFVELKALKGSTASYELMGELGLMVWVIVASALLVDLVVSVLRITWWTASQQWLVLEGMVGMYPSQKP